MQGAFKRSAEAFRYAMFRTGFDWYYHRFVLREGAWRTPFLVRLNLRDGERILEIHRHGSCVTTGITERHPKTQFDLVDVDPVPGTANTGSIAFENNRLTCNGGQFDKVVCSMALHPLSPGLKVALLGEMRRVLRNGGKLYVADFDAPVEKRQGTILRGLSYKFGQESAGPHSDGTWTGAIEKAGFTQIKRLQSVPEWHSRVTILRARR